MQSNPVRSTLLALAVLTVAPAFGAAQSAPCHVENDGPNFNNGISMGGPGLLLAIRIVAPSNLDVQRLEIFTGERQGTNLLGLWSHDAANNQPLVDLGTGAWPMNQVNSWQGVDLPGVVSLASGQTYWVVWGPQNAAQASLDPRRPSRVRSTAAPSSCRP